MLNTMSLFARLAFVVVLALSAAGDAFAFGHRDVVDSASRARVCETALQGETASVRLQHPFWVNEKGWTAAGKLVVGDQVLSAHDGWLRVGSATWQQARETVYNFEVEEFHTYFVGEAGAWVHNANGDGTCGWLPDRTQGTTEGLQALFGVDLPRSNFKDTKGVLVTADPTSPGGFVVENLQNGGANPQHSNYISAGHAEGKAALSMRDSGPQQGLVFHNNEGGTCSYCNGMLETMLPPGVRMTVMPPTSQTVLVPPKRGASLTPRAFVGNADPMKPNTRKE
jgi:hypothetical protein